MNSKLLQMACEECSLPPNFVTVVKINKDEEEMTCTTCRDCGEYWEEPLAADENFLNNRDD